MTNKNFKPGTLLRVQKTTVFHTGFVPVLNNRNNHFEWIPPHSVLMFLENKVDPHIRIIDREKWIKVLMGEMVCYIFGDYVEEI